MEKQGLPERCQPGFNQGYALMEASLAYSRLLLPVSGRGGGRATRLGCSLLNNSGHHLALVLPPVSCWHKHLFTCGEEEPGS